MVKSTLHSLHIHRSDQVGFLSVEKSPALTEEHSLWYHLLQRPLRRLQLPVSQYLQEALSFSGIFAMNAPVQTSLPVPDSIITAAQVCV
jgi:hypothetical protein